MSKKIKAILSDSKLAELLDAVLASFGPRYFKAMKDCIDDGITDDDAIFAKLAESEEAKLNDKVFNDMKLVGAFKVFGRFLRPHKRMKVLDFGGAALELVKDIGLENITVADIHPENYAIKDNRLTYVRLDSGEPPFKNSYYDVVCAMMTLHHIKDVDATISMLHRATRKWLIIQEHDATVGYPDILDIVHGMYIYVKKDQD
jgi:hypothetical protein